MTEFLEHGDFAYDPDSRTLRGILLPFGETSRINSTGNGPLSFDADSITLPRDPSVVTLNRKHNKYDPVGRATVLEKRPEGVYAEFSVANTDEGDAYLNEERDELKKLSPEVDGLLVRAGRAIKSRLTGAALVPEGAFVSAALFAIGDVEVEAEETQTPETTPESDNPEEEAVTATDIVPDGVATPEAQKIDTSASALFSSLTSLNTRGTPVAADFAVADFALADITGSGIGADIEAPQYVGELWQARTYQQKVLPLFGHANLNSYTVTGFRWVTPPVVGLYSGNKTEIPSAAVDTEPYSVTAQRIAGGHDIDRRFRDFGNQAFWDGYFRHMTSSYAKVADDYVFTQIEDAADANVVSVDDEGVTDPFAWIVDAALEIVDNGLTPSFALVAPSVYRAIIQKPKDETLEYFNSAFGLEDGTFGGFTVRPHAGVATAGHLAIVGSRDAATVYELPGSPIRVEGIDVAKAGIDPALYGYIAVTINNAAGLTVIQGDV
jgi:hypothetical protein